MTREGSNHLLCLYIPSRLIDAVVRVRDIMPYAPQRQGDASWPGPRPRNLAPRRRLGLGGIGFASRKPVECLIPSFPLKPGRLTHPLGDRPAQLGSVDETLAQRETPIHHRLCRRVLFFCLGGPGRCPGSGARVAQQGPRHARAQLPCLAPAARLVSARPRQGRGDAPCLSRRLGPGRTMVTDSPPRIADGVAAVLRGRGPEPFQIGPQHGLFLAPAAHVLGARPGLSLGCGCRRRPRRRRPLARLGRRGPRHRGRCGPGREDWGGGRVGAGWGGAGARVAGGEGGRGGGGAGATWGDAGR